MKKRDHSQGDPSQDKEAVTRQITTTARQTTRQAGNHKARLDYRTICTPAKAGVFLASKSSRRGNYLRPIEEGGPRTGIGLRVRGRVRMRFRVGVGVRGKGKRVRARVSVRI